MSSFTSPAQLELQDDGYTFKLLAPFEYHVGDFPSVEVITVPTGYVTDLASVPRIFWNIVPPHGKYAKAAIVHDYLYSRAIKTKDYADNIFYEAMGVLCVPMWKRKVMYLAVKYFGKGEYK